ncbi:glutamine amidotransferase [Affinibrenneria salicis]|uniref:Glutamine amidotransferase n=2 Tax=Affinibrenneria salicis TaxID=2590031 RepID=A0A5J5G204_9GAMM|nr:glutamine amidotransferase [Affinibrenneria salicis]
MGEPPQAVAREVGQQADWFSAALPVSEGQLLVVRPDRGMPLPPADQVAAAIISGSWSMVTDRLAWSEYTAGWVRQAFAQALPMLGVCYGHQLIAHALGGTVADNPRGREVGEQMISLAGAVDGDPLLGSLPAQFSAWLSHRQSVIEPPTGAQVLGRSQLDDCQIVRYSDSVLSVQFHPEFTGSVMASCLRHSASQPQAAEQSIAAVSGEPVWARKILLNFFRRYAGEIGG